jgi:NADPH:quinone reductase-like Zn-dependent oxidoreductase
VDKVLEMIGTTTLKDSLLCAKEGGMVCMTGIVANKWSLDEFAPMEATPTGVYLTAYGGESEDFMRTPPNELAQQIQSGALHIQAGKAFHLDEIELMNHLMEDNKAGARSSLFFLAERVFARTTRM